jgi:glycosyltransferase involved in cell wall biosynthesis
MSRVRILYLQSTSETGGSDISLLRIVQKLDKNRFQAFVALPSDGPLVDQLEDAGCEVFILSDMKKLTTRRGKRYFLSYLLNYPRAVLAILRLIREQKIDLVHTNTLHNLYGFMAARLAGLNHVWHVREIVLQSKIVRPIELFLARRFSDRVVVTSEAVGEMFSDRAGVPPSNLRKIPNAIDTELYHPRNDGASIFEEMKIQAGIPLVGLVCRMDHWKGVDTFLKAAAICKKEFPDARYLVVGGAIEGREAYASEMEQLAGELRVNDVVRFTGWRYRTQDMPKVHAALDVLVLASRWPEPFGLVLLEAMATGKPIVSTDQGGPREICVDGETAILVPPQDPEKMAAAILSLLRDPSRARQMGVAGRKRVEELFDRNRCIKTLESMYTELLAS